MFREFMLSEAAFDLAILFVMVLAVIAIWGVWKRDEPIKPEPTLREQIQQERRKGRWK